MGIFPGKTIFQEQASLTTIIFRQTSLQCLPVSVVADTRPQEEDHR